MQVATQLLAHQTWISSAQILLARSSICLRMQVPFSHPFCGSAHAVFCLIPCLLASSVASACHRPNRKGAFLVRLLFLSRYRLSIILHEFRDPLRSLLPPDTTSYVATATTVLVRGPCDIRVVLVAMKGGCVACSMSARRISVANPTLPLIQLFPYCQNVPFQHTNTIFGPCLHRMQYHLQQVYGVPCGESGLFVDSGAVDYNVVLELCMK